MEEERLKAILESLLFAAGEPVPLAGLANAIDDVARDEIRKALGEMTTAYAGGIRGIVLEEVAGGYQLRTPREHAFYVRRLLAAKPPRLSRPLLETLAIVAYRQPITRPEIEQLRGVDSGGVIDTLIERGFIKIAGRKEAPGRPMVYATTPAFLEVFGLKDLDGLPDLEEFRALEGSDYAAAHVEDPRGENVESFAPENGVELPNSETESTMPESETAAADGSDERHGSEHDSIAGAEKAAHDGRAHAEIESEGAPHTGQDRVAVGDTAVHDSDRTESVHEVATGATDEPEDASASADPKDRAARRESEDHD